MQINQNEFDKLAEMSCLTFTKEQKVKFIEELNDMIDFLLQINDIQLAENKYEHYLTGQKFIFRNDQPEQIMNIKTIEKNSARFIGGFFELPFIKKDFYH